MTLNLTLVDPTHSFRYNLLTILRLMDGTVL